jgi:hypothetical protein
MATNKAPNHLHRYKKVNLSRKPGHEFLVYKCTKPACPHYIRLELVEGKLCECNRCGDPMIITRETLIHSSGKPMAKPHCNNCVVRKKSDDIAALAQFLGKKGA